MGGIYMYTYYVIYTHQEMRMILSERAVAYLNCDSGVVQTHMLSALSTPLMYDLIHNSAKQVSHVHCQRRMALNLCVR